MPEFVFKGPAPGMYPMLRDAHGNLAGLVTPGDIREFDAAPDADWQPYEPPPPPAAPAKTPAAAPATTRRPTPPPSDTGNAGTGQDDNNTAGPAGSEEA